MKERKTGKKIRLLIGILAVFLLGTGAFALYAAAEGTAGTSSDPVVTKSYVDHVVAELKQSLGGTASGGSTGSGQQNSGESQGNSGSSGLTIIELQKGEKLIGYQNTQIIVRTGTVLVSIPGENGISDLTEGKDLTNGVTVQKNHLLLVPRSDGRGIKAETSAFVMVQGDYMVSR